jgi:hypothetical protein
MGWEPPCDTKALGHPVPLLFWRFWGEANGSPKFPSCPFERMPCPQTPVVSCSLAITLSGLLPSVSPTTSAFPGFLSRLSFVHYHILFRGSITRPAFLFHPVSYFHYWFCTWVSLLTCWLGFDQMGFEFRREYSTRTHWTTLTNFKDLL